LSTPQVEKAVADFTAVIEMADAPPEQRARALSARSAAYDELAAADSAAVAKLVDARRKGWNRLTVMTGLFAWLLLLHTIVTIGRVHLPQRVSASVVRDIRYQLYAHVQRLSLGFHTSRPSGTIASRVITDVQTAQQAIELGLIVSLQGGMQIVVIACIMLYMNWLWALICFSVVPLFLITTHLLRRPLRTASRRMLESTEQMSGYMHERFGMIREVQSFGAEHAEQARVWHHTEQLRGHSVRHSLLNGLLTAAGEGTTYLGLAVVLLFGIYCVSAGKVRIGDFTTFYLFTQRLFTPVQWLTGSYGQLQTAMSATERIFEFFDTEPKVQDSPGAAALELHGAPAVRLENVCFSYPVDKPQIVLKDLSFEAPPGSRVALVGPSGGGKSTTLSLLPRFYDVQGGRILIDGHEIRDVTVRSLRKAIGLVPQEPVLFSGTIRENILYGRQGALENDVLHAATSANAHDFIMEQECDYDTVVGERGVGLSGGQIQRIAIARAFLKDPPILIMDEPTSNLDAVSESLILGAIDRLAEGRTTFVVAHRLSVARSADMILVIEDGRLVEQGHHDDLLERRGTYANLWRRQVG
ncbi:MAG: ABC transporter ATP-binding protein, partial [Phycisphaerae bacterium]|nr:ABC transporter ATP-binding protein [Phycisphaerae bacterium]